jgi:hypothetical protein
MFRLWNAESSIPESPLERPASPPSTIAKGKPTSTLVRGRMPYAISGIEAPVVDAAALPLQPQRRAP